VASMASNRHRAEKIRGCKAEKEAEGTVEAVGARRVMPPCRLRGGVWGETDEV